MRHSVYASSRVARQPANPARFALCKTAKPLAPIIPANRTPRKRTPWFVQVHVECEGTTRAHSPYQVASGAIKKHAFKCNKHLGAHLPCKLQCHPRRAINCRTILTAFLFLERHDGLVLLTPCKLNSTAIRFQQN